MGESMIARARLTKSESIRDRLAFEESVCAPVVAGIDVFLASERSEYFVEHTKSAPPHEAVIQRHIIGNPESTGLEPSKELVSPSKEPGFRFHFRITGFFMFYICDEASVSMGMEVENICRICGQACFLLMCGFFYQLIQHIYFVIEKIITTACVRGKRKRLRQRGFCIFYKKKRFMRHIII
jgi:hypothetical protein